MRWRFRWAPLSPAYADGATVTKITNKKTGVTYENLATATADAKSGESILLPEGNYTLYKVSSEGHTKGKDLTFEGSGTDKTSWRIGPEVPDPKHETTSTTAIIRLMAPAPLRFKNMKMLSAHANYLGFIRIDNTVVDNCIVEGKTFYWGYKTAVFRNTTFNAPGGDYSLWTYSSPTMTFDTCTFNATGKVINVYTDYGAGKNNIIVNVNDCTFNSETSWLFHKQALNINDSNMGTSSTSSTVPGTNTVNYR